MATVKSVEHTVEVYVPYHGWHEVTIQLTAMTSRDPVHLVDLPIGAPRLSKCLIRHVVSLFEGDDTQT